MDDVLTIFRVFLPVFLVMIIIALGCAAATVADRLSKKRLGVK